jgi:hypothetical protein
MSLQAPKLREAAFNDYPAIAELQSRYGLPAKSRHEWEHLWINNPAFRAAAPKMAIGWVLEDGGGRIVAYLGNIPLFYEICGEKILASVAHAWVAETNYRAFSLLLLEQYFRQRSVELFINATVGPLAVQAFSTFQSLPVPVGDWDRSVFWITNYTGFVTGWLAKQTLPQFRPLAYFLSAGLYAKDTLASPVPKPANNGVKLAPCSQFDERFDLFWDALRATSPHILLGVRTREMLHWHFAAALGNGRAWVLTAEACGKTCAYAIFFRHDSEQLGLRRMRLVDFQALDGDTHVLAPMLSWGLARCRQEGIDMLECIGFRHEKNEVIKKFAPHRRELPAWLFFYKTRDAALAQSLSDASVWDPSQFDGDASL